MFVLCLGEFVFMNGCVDDGRISIEPHEQEKGSEGHSERQTKNSNSPVAAFFFFFF